MAAIVGSVARPPSSDESPEPADPATDRERPATPSATSTPPDGVRTIEIPPRGERAPVRLAPGRPATVIVAVRAPGQVEIPSLGLVQAGEPLTPARFDILVTSPGSHRIVVRPASPSAARRQVATLAVAAKP